MRAIMPNTLYYGDNLEVLRRYVDAESVDLVYLNPPFDSNASYNVLFKEQSGEESPAQIKAFTDTWEWTQESQRMFEQEIILNPDTPANVKERLGYPTQKPLPLLERIIQASSNEGDVVLDPFCGCGTAVVAAQKLNREWIGIDITHLAVALMKNRLKTSFGIVSGKDYQVVGQPVDVGSARALAESDRYQFQYWAMSLLEAFPREDNKKGADKGMDGVVYFLDGPNRSTNKAIIQVKSGKVSSPHIRDLKGTVERDKAALGLFITLDNPTPPMVTEAVSAGFYHSEVWQKDYPKIQIRTVAELLDGTGFDLPPHPSMYQAAQRVQRSEGRQTSLDDAVNG
jgi:SAM-dependent methyltransferase